MIEDADREERLHTWRKYDKDLRERNRLTRTERFRQNHDLARDRLHLVDLNPVRQSLHARRLASGPLPAETPKAVVNYL